MKIFLLLLLRLSVFCNGQASCTSPVYSLSQISNTGPCSASTYSINIVAANCTINVLSITTAVT